MEALTVMTPKVFQLISKVAPRAVNALIKLSNKNFSKTPNLKSFH
jgi:hypothetical protein